MYRYYPFSNSLDPVLMKLTEVLGLMDYFILAFACNKILNSRL